jgi:hypothetical protein
MYRLIPLRADNVAADVRKFFHEYDSMVKYLKDHLDDMHEYPTVQINYNSDIAYVIHSGINPDEYDYQGKTPQEILDNGGHVIPADDRTRALRDIEALRRRTGKETVHQVMIVSPQKGTEVIYLHQPGKEESSGLSPEL